MWWLPSAACVSRTSTSLCYTWDGMKIFCPSSICCTIYPHFLLLLQEKWAWEIEGATLGHPWPCNYPCNSLPIFPSWDGEWEGRGLQQWWSWRRMPPCSLFLLTYLSQANGKMITAIALLCSNSPPSEWLSGRLVEAVGRCGWCRRHSLLACCLVWLHHPAPQAEWACM